jgi:hypothetical protein
MEICVIDMRRTGDLSVVRNISVREFTADDVRVVGQGCDGLGREFYIVGDTWVVITIISLVPIPTPLSTDLKDMG